MFGAAAKTFFADNGVSRDGAGPFDRLGAGQRPAIHSLMRAAFMTMDEELRAEQPQMVLAEDDEMIQRFRFYGLHESLAMSVQIRRRCGEVEKAGRRRGWGGAGLQA